MYAMASMCNHKYLLGKGWGCFLLVARGGLRQASFLSIVRPAQQRQKKAQDVPNRSRQLKLTSVRLLSSLGVKRETKRALEQWKALRPGRWQSGHLASHQLQRSLQRLRDLFRHFEFRHRRFSDSGGKSLCASQQRSSTLPVCCCC